MTDETSSVSQNEESSVEVERDAATEALFNEFSVSKPVAPKKEIEMPDLSFGEESEEEDEEDEDPAIDQDEPPAPDSKKRVVKFNKEDREIDESEVDELLQKGLALDKERERRAEYEKNLDRVAKLQGYKDHAELIANLDKIEQEEQQKQEDQFKNLKQEMIEEYQDAGGDPSKLESWLENHPLLKQAQSAITEKQKVEEERTQQNAENQRLAGWAQLYEAFPDIAEDAAAFSKGDRPTFYTAEMESMIGRGLKPLEAYTLLNMNKIQTQTKKQMEQKLIKQQQLGNRAQVQGNAVEQADDGILTPAHMSLAAEFGVDVKGVRQQQKLINSRR